MKKSKIGQLKKELPNLKQNVSLKGYTTFKIGGKARYFFVAKKEKDLIKAIILAKKNNISFFILGSGSNLLVSDSGFNGLVIKNQISKIKIKNDKYAYVESGTPLAKLINLPGLEWAVGIPGTLGGAIYGNAGAFGNSIKDNLKNIKVFNFKNLKTKNYISKNCKFSYRESCFKKNKNLIILSANLILKKENKSKVQKYLNYKKKTQPLNFSSAGSVFKNCKKIIKNKKLIAEYPEIKEFNKKGVIPTAWLIERCGLKGKIIGNVKISEKHANFILNLRKGKAKDVKKLMNLIKKKVKNKFGIKLQEEIQIL